MFKNELEIDVGRCIKALFKKAGFICVIAVLFFIARTGMTLSVGEDKYTAQSTVYAASSSSYSESANAVTAMNAYLDVATSYKVCQRAALILGRSDVDATFVKNSVGVGSSVRRTSSNSTVSSFMNSSGTVITIYATTTDPELSMAMADAMAQSYSIEMNSILNNDSLKILDGAYTNYQSYNAHREAWKSRIQFAILGFGLACILVIFTELFDNKIRTIREATIRNNLPVIGIIPDYKD